MSVDTLVKERLAKVHSTGYWRVMIRPTVFDKVRVSTLAQCREIVRGSIVSLRGWDYPHWKETEVRNGQDWIEGGSDFVSHVEYWRFYQSGQFVHHFAMAEDYEQKAFGPQRRSQGAPLLSILSTLFSVTEIYEFAARLCAKDILQPSVEINVRLFGTEGRTLTFWQPGRHTWGTYTCTLPDVQYEQQHGLDELLGGAQGLAISTVVSLFERFNWVAPPLSLLQNEQQKLIEHRL